MLGFNKKTFAENLFYHVHELDKAEGELHRHIANIMFNLDVKDGNDDNILKFFEHVEDVTFDWYDLSFELKGCKPEEKELYNNITRDQLKQFSELGFDRCWFCFNDGTEISVGFNYRLKNMENTK